MRIKSFKLSLDCGIFRLRLPAGEVHAFIALVPGLYARDASLVTVISYDLYPSYAAINSYTFI